MHSYIIQIICKKMYLAHRREPNSYYHFSSVDLGVIAMKWYFTITRAPELEPHQTYLAHRREPKSYYHFSSVDLGVIAMKWYFTFTRAPELEPHQMQFSAIHRTTFFLKKKSYPFAEKMLAYSLAVSCVYW